MTRPRPTHLASGRCAPVSRPDRRRRPRPHRVPVESEAACAQRITDGPMRRAAGAEQVDDRPQDTAAAIGMSAISRNQVHHRPEEDLFELLAVRTGLHPVRSARQWRMSLSSWHLSSCPERQCDLLVVRRAPVEFPRPRAGAATCRADPGSRVRPARPDGVRRSPPNPRRAVRAAAVASSRCRATSFVPPSPPSASSSSASVRVSASRGYARSGTRCPRVGPPRGDRHLPQALRLPAEQSQTPTRITRGMASFACTRQVSDRSR